VLEDDDNGSAVGVELALFDAVGFLAVSESEG